MNLRLERAGADDAAAIAAMRLGAARALATEHGAGPWSLASDTVDGVRLECAGGNIWVAREEGVVRGTLKLSRSNPWLTDTSCFTPAAEPWFVTAMAVAPAQQRRGVGRACLVEVERIVREAGGDAIRLDSHDAPAGAVGFYERCGFRAVKRGNYLGVKLVWLERVWGKEKGAPGGRA